MQAKKGGLHESLGKLSPSEKQIVEYVAILGMTKETAPRPWTIAKEQSNVIEPV